MKNNTEAYSPYSTPGLTYLVAAAVLAIALATAHAGPPPVVPPISTAGNVGANIGLGNPRIGAADAGAVNGSTRGISGSAQGGGAFSTPGGSSTSAGEFESIGMRQERARAQAGVTPGAADTRASVMGDARGRTVATQVAPAASASLNASETVHSIQAQAMDSREQLLAELHTRVDTSAKAMASVRQSGAKLEGDAKTNFAAASAVVKAREKALNKSLKAAEKSDAKGWVSARAKLADDYDAYAAAVSRAEVTSRIQAEEPKS